MENMPCDLCSLGLKGPELSEGKEQICKKGTDVGRNCRGSEAKKQDHRQEKARGFLWEFRENWQQGGKPRQQGKSLEHFQVLAVGPGNSWQS